MRKGDMHQEDDWEAKARDDALLEKELWAALCIVAVLVLIGAFFLIGAIIGIARLI